LAHPTRIFKEPEELEKAWGDYKDWLKEESVNWPKVQYVGKDGEKKIDYPILPMSQDGFEIYCYDNQGCVEQYFKNQGGYYDDFIPLCSRIRKEIRVQHIIGGQLNYFNASITQRLHGLADKSEITENREQPLFGKNN